MFRVCSFLLLCLFTPLAAPAEIAGRVQVIDGDTFDIGGTRVRLHGIDAPEMGQPCTTDRGQTWDCGAWARTEARRLFQSRRAACALIDHDRYGRAVARCSVGGQDMGARLVAEGIAFAFRRYAMDYDLTEKQAAVAGVGLWSMTVEEPAAWRSNPSGGQASARTAAPAADCNIKGNISNSGRIYHMPHNEHYDRTRIDPARGERWFCSEAEARAAGWRPARN